MKDKILYLYSEFFFIIKCKTGPKEHPRGAPRQGPATQGRAGHHQGDLLMMTWASSLQIIFASAIVPECKLLGNIFSALWPDFGRK